jgi:serine protease AprX
VDVSQVIAAIDWVVQHKTDNGMNIRVLNLSYGTDSLQAYTIDPLAFAIEQAWKAGIFVVTATGNAGFVAHTGLHQPGGRRSSQLARRTR